MSHLLLCLCFIPWVCVYFHLPCFSTSDSLRVSASLCDLCQVGHASPVLLLHFLFYFGGWCSLSWVSLLFPRLIINYPHLCSHWYPHPRCPVFWPSWLCFFVLHSVFYVLDAVLCILFVFLCIVNYLHSSFVSSFWSRSTSCLPHWRVITAVSFLSLATDQVVVVVHLLQSYMTECKSVVAYLVQQVSRCCLIWSCSAVKTYLPHFLLSYHFSWFRSNQF